MYRSVLGMAKCKPQKGRGTGWLSVEGLIVTGIGTPNAALSESKIKQPNYQAVIQVNVEPTNCKSNKPPRIS
jgi:hypothetical protein